MTITTVLLTVALALFALATTLFYSAMKDQESRRNYAFWLLRKKSKFAILYYKQTARFLWHLQQLFGGPLSGKAFGVCYWVALLYSSLALLAAIFLGDSSFVGTAFQSTLASEVRLRILVVAMVVLSLYLAVLVACSHIKQQERLSGQLHRLGLGRRRVDEIWLNRLYYLVVGLALAAFLRLVAKVAGLPTGVALTTCLAAIGLGSLVITFVHYRGVDDLGPAAGSGGGAIIGAALAFSRWDVALILLSMMVTIKPKKVFSITAIFVATCLVAVLLRTDRTDLILFLFLYLGLPLANSHLDWLSFGISRLLYKEVAKARRGRIAIAAIICDLGLAFALLLAAVGLLTVTIVASNISLGQESGDALVEISKARESLSGEGVTVATTWISIFLVSTLAPTALHLAYSAVALVLSVRSPLSWRRYLAAHLASGVAARSLLPAAYFAGTLTSWVVAAIAGLWLLSVAFGPVTDSVLEIGVEVSAWSESFLLGLLGAS